MILSNSLRSLSWFVTADRTTAGVLPGSRNVGDVSGPSARDTQSIAGGGDEATRGRAGKGWATPPVSYGRASLEAPGGIGEGLRHRRLRTGRLRTRGARPLARGGRGTGGGHRRCREPFRRRGRERLRQGLHGASLSADPQQ